MKKMIASIVAFMLMLGAVGAPAFAGKQCTCKPCKCNPCQCAKK